MFWGEFEKMEETLVCGNLKFVEKELNACYSGGNRKEGQRESRKVGKKSEKHLERKREIVGFREKICEVFRGFHQFQSNLVDKISCNPVSRTVKKTDLSKNWVDAQGRVEISRKPDDKQPDEGLSLSTSAFVARDDEDDEGGDMDDEPMHLDNYDEDHDNFSDDNQNQVETKPTDKRASLRQRDKKKENRTVVDSEEEDNPDNSGDDDDEEYEPAEETVNETPSYPTQIRNLFREYEPHLAQLSPFKRNTVKSVLKYQCSNENLQKRKGPENINVYQRHMTYLTYNVETELINLKDVQIKIVCQADGEDGENGLICMKCGFKVAESPKMQNLMYHHILSEHLNAYQCPHCKKKFGTYKLYRKHVWRRHETPNPLKRDCDICGKTFSEKRTLQNHKWFTHMSDQEKREALESGMFKKAPQVKSTKEMKRKYQCETCGKSFISPSNLEDHEKIHQDKESREQFICEKCGKSFLKTSYDYHLRYSVSCGEDGDGGRVESCEICGKSFKNRILLRRHVKVMHVERDMFVCGTCGKGFRTKGGLKKHQISHTGEKPWGCGNCGKGFSDKSNMQRHEKSCGK